MLDGEWLCRHTHTQASGYGLHRETNRYRTDFRDQGEALSGSSPDQDSESFLFAFPCFWWLLGRAS